MEDYREIIWIDQKGRQIKVHTMSNRWLNNIRKKFKGSDDIKPILDELKRRKKLNQPK